MVADPTVAFLDAQADAATFAEELSDFLDRHLAVEDQDVLPLFWRHYTAEEYDTVLQQAVKKGKKAGMCSSRRSRSIGTPKAPTAHTRH